MSIGLALPVAADPLEFPLFEVLELAEAADHPRASFEELLSEVLPLTVTPQDPPPSDLFDPFLWAMSGSFGGEGAAPRPGAIFRCARYGLATRDAFAERGMVERDMFLLMRAVLPAFDDPDVWPDGAIARLSCTFVWDDEETIAILERATAEQALIALFTSLADAPDSLENPDVFGERGFDLTGRVGLQTSVVHVESAQVALILGHQLVVFRSFLMGGGV